MLFKRQTNSSTTAMQSLYSELDALIAFKFHVKQKKISHHNQLVANSTGSHHSLRKGRGMTFSEVRQYQAGDDARHIDWRVTARTQKAHTKVFTEEHERPIVFLTEQSPALLFGSQVRLKIAQAMNLTAIIGWTALQQNERVGGLCFSTQQHSWVAPKRSQQTLLHLLQQGITLQQSLQQPEMISENTWSSQLHQLSKTIKPGSKVFLIGDLLNLNQTCFQQLQQLKKHNDIVLLHIYDQIERHLPSQGWLILTSDYQGEGNTQLTINSDDGAIQQQYHQGYLNLWQPLKKFSAQSRIPLLEIACHENPLSTLLAHKVIV